MNDKEIVILLLLGSVAYTSFPSAQSPYHFPSCTHREGEMHNTRMPHEHIAIAENESTGMFENFLRNTSALCVHASSPIQFHEIFPRARSCRRCQGVS